MESRPGTLDTEPAPALCRVGTRTGKGTPTMFAENSQLGDPTPLPLAASEPRGPHLMLVRTPKLTLRGRLWLERSRSGAFDPLTLQRLICLEQLSLG